MKQGLWHCFIFNSYMKLCGTYSEMKTITKSLFKVSQPRESCNKLDRPDQVIIFRLRTGHNRQNKHLHMLNIIRSWRCPCGKDDQTAKHILQDCRNLQTLRENTWSTTESLQEKLYGPMDMLQKTTHFITASGVQL